MHEDEKISLAKGTTQLQILSVINELHYKYKDFKSGHIANYIPELAKASPDWFAISAVTTGGQIYEVGDYKQNFTIQAAANPFLYGMALEDHGREFIKKKVGVEPSGEAFNAISLKRTSKRPHNPMINAGAIAMASLIKGNGRTERLNRMLDMFSRYVGEEVYVNMPVFLSEKSTGHRNRSIAHLMHNFEMIETDIETALDLYFQQCSVMVNCRRLAIMAATLANKGVNPFTGVRALEGEYVKDVLSVMFTCGLYDSSGHWAYTGGIPAKSGVSGGFFAVVPQQVGIAVFSPLVDERGNSERGIKVCKELSERFKLHIFDVFTGEVDFSNIARPE